MRKKGFAAGIHPKRLAAVTIGEPKKARHKFGAVRTELDGISYPSKAEAEYAAHLKILQQSGELVMFIRQPSFDLQGGVRYVSDFLCFWADGTADTRDVKGVETAEFKLKLRQVRAAYPAMTFLKVKKSGKSWSVSE